MTELSDKKNLLNAEGYAYSFNRQVYYNRDSRKVFSLEFIEDHNTVNLRNHIHEYTNGQNWRFYFNEAPPNSVKRELETALG